jgi:hypothetical protein
MNREIAFFDLDGTLWNIKNEDIWIIDKDKPYKALMILDKIEFSMIVNGKYRKDDHPLKYNGQTHYISNELFDKLKKLSKSDNIERFGISFIPLVRKEILDKREIEILFKNIEHLRYNRFVDIGLLTARSNQRNHVDVINKLRIELKKIGIEISKIFFVGEGLRLGQDYKRKTYVLLEHLVGLKIKDGKFISIKQDWYKKVSFYDDDVKNIDYANSVQEFFEDLLRNSDDDVFRIILDRINSYPLKLENNLITDNDINRFKTTSFILKEPMKYPLQKNNMFFDDKDF